MDARASRTFAINGVIVDVAGGLLRDRKGREIALRPQAFDLLRYLLENADRLVTKEELMKAVWPGVFVTDDSLVQCVRDIRRALGDEAHAVLQTVPKRGYRMVLPAMAEASHRSAQRWWLTVMAVVLATGAAGAWWIAQRPAPGGVPLVAVLPFHAVTEDEGTRLLAKGLTEDVITDLGRIPEFEVLASGATAGYRGQDADPRAVGSALNAAFVVEGSIARDADRVRVTAQLVDAGTGGSLWSERWERPAADVFAVQSEIADRIANRLGGGDGLVQESGRIAAHRKPPGSLSAYELYLLGTEKLERITVPDAEAAIALLNRAVATDPGFARAWIELSHAHGILADHGVEMEANRAVAREAAERALALDPGDAEAHVVMGWVLGVAGDLVRSKAEFDIALQLAPNATEILTLYAAWASGFGEPERGAALVDRVVRLEPNFSTWKAAPFSYAYFMAGRNEEALDMIDRLAVENYYAVTWAFKAGALAALGRLEEARRVSAQAAVAHPELSIEALINDPGWSETEHQRFIDTLRPAGFPPCATPEVLAKIENPKRLPECQAKQPMESRSVGGVPFVAVLPFINVAGDEASQRLATGLKKDFYTDLARFREFQIVLRNSNYVPISDPVDVSFVLGGAIQREGDRLRITTQLFDAKTGNLLWSERWDRPDNDVFAIQTEISKHVSNRLGGNSGLIQEAGLIAARRKTVDDLTAYDLYLLGVEKLERINRTDIEEAIRLLDRSAKLAPELARVWVELCLAHEMMADFGVEPERNRQAASYAAVRAVELNPRDAKAHAVLGISLAHKNDFARARSEFDTALHLAPDALDILTLYGGWASRFGEPERGVEIVDRVAGQDPNFPILAARQFSYAYFMAGRYKDALTMIDRLTTDNYSVLTWAMRSAALAAVGRVEEAREWVGKAIAGRPDLTIEAIANEPGFSDAERQRLIDTMRLSGFPLCATDAQLAKGTMGPRRLPECKAK